MSPRIALLIALVSIFQVGNWGAARAADVVEPGRRQILLSDGWVVKQLDSDQPDVAALLRESASPDKTWLPARMPAQVHDILLAHGQIPDPHIGMNASASAWVGDKNWAYYLEPKIAHYFLRRAYEPVLVSFEKASDRINVWVINDSPRSVSGTLVVQRLDFAGKALGKLQVKVSVKPGEARRCLNTTDLGEISLRSQFLHASFAGREAIALLTGERYLHLPPARLTVRRDGNSAEITTDTFSRQVTLEFTGVTGAVFEDNFFDLLPGRKRTISVLNDADGHTFTVRALNADGCQSGMETMKVCTN